MVLPTYLAERKEPPKSSRYLRRFAQPSHRLKPVQEPAGQERKGVVLVVDQHIAEREMMHPVAAGIRQHRRDVRLDDTRLGIQAS